MGEINTDSLAAPDQVLIDMFNTSHTFRNTWDNPAPTELMPAIAGSVSYLVEDIRTIFFGSLG